MNWNYQRMTTNDDEEDEQWQWQWQCSPLVGLIASHNHITITTTTSICPSHHLTAHHQHNLLQYCLMQPWNWPNGQPAAPVSINEEKVVKRDKRGEQVAHHYPITSHNAQCMSLDVHVAFVRCEGLQTHGFHMNPQLFGVQVWVGIFQPMGYLCWTLLLQFASRRDCMSKPL